MLRLPLVTWPLALALTEQKAFRLISNVMLNGSKCEERKEERRHLITRHVENRRAFKRPAFLKRHPPDPRVSIKFYTLHPIIDVGVACVNLSFFLPFSMNINPVSCDDLICDMEDDLLYTVPLRMDDNVVDHIIFHQQLLSYIYIYIRSHRLRLLLNQGASGG